MQERNVHSTQFQKIIRFQQKFQWSGGIDKFVQYLTFQVINEPILISVAKAKTATCSRKCFKRPFQMTANKEKITIVRNKEI